MKTVVCSVAVLLLVGLLATPAAAVELRVTGFIDNAVEYDNNVSGIENNVTSNKDRAFFGSTRGQFFFNFIASDDLRGIWAMEFDSIWGAPARDRLSSRCVTAEQCGFRNNIDVNNFELKQLYVDFRIPQLGIGNRWQVGGPRLESTPLLGNLVYQNDAGGVITKFNLTPQVDLMLYYIQLEENVESYPGSVKIGEDYLTGTELLLKPVPGWDLGLIYTYQSLQAPWGNSFTVLNGPFSTRTGDTTNVIGESRHYMGFESRYRLGNLSIEPAFVYLYGTRKFCQPGQVISAGLSQVSDGGITFSSIIGSGGALSTTCPAAPASPNSSSKPTGPAREIDRRAYEASLQLHFTMGRWLLSGKAGYISGDKATTDVNNQGLTNGRTSGKIEGFAVAGLDGSNKVTDWLDLLGRGELLSGRTVVSPYRLGEGGIGLNRFGYQTVAGKAEYKLTDSLLLRGIAGAVWTAETPACPAIDRTGTVTATNPTGCSVTATNPFNVNAQNSITGAGRNFTGHSRYIGTEFDAHLQWTIMPGLVNIIGGGYAFIGDALQIQTCVTCLPGKVQNMFMVTNRLLYAF